MALFRVTGDQKSPIVQELSDLEVKTIKRKSKKVSVGLSTNVLEHMKKKAGIRGLASNEAILKAYITYSIDRDE